MIAPAIDELAKEYAGKIACFKLNTDDCPNIARVWNQKHSNCSALQKWRKESVIGAVPKSTLSAAVDKYVDV